jgi:serine/threonine protein kinase
MAPELIDPSRFGRNFARTPATDVYAFGCVCLEVNSLLSQSSFIRSDSSQLYTGRPPFANLSETAAMLRVIDGDRPDQPSSEHEMSGMLWQYINKFWAQDPATRPTAQEVARDMAHNFVSWLATQSPAPSEYIPEPDPSDSDAVWWAE